MASILDRYGIKEVADVTFYDIGSDGKPTNPVLYLDSLKVSTLEQTAESSYAQGGKGNPRLIGWDFGKEITLSLEDALFSAKSMAIMFGNGKVDTLGEGATIKKTITFKGAEVPTVWNSPDGPKTINTEGAKVYNANGEDMTSKTLDANETYFYTFDVKVKGGEIVVGPNTFPGTLAA